MSDGQNALVLIVEDQPDLADIFRGYFERESFRVVMADDGDKAVQLHDHLRPDLIVLDVRLPKRDGIEVLAAIRRSHDTPCIMATASGEELQRLLALTVGADDYLVKPFNPAELILRAKAILRRTRGVSGAAVLRVGSLEVRPAEHVAQICGDEGRSRPLDLTLTEFRILHHLAQSPRRVFTRGDLVDACLPSDREALERTVDSHIRNLRAKLAGAGAPDIIASVRGVGYRLLAL